MMKKILILFFMVSNAWAFSPTPTPNWNLITKEYINGTTGQRVVNAYPSGVNTWTPTPTYTATLTQMNVSMNGKSLGAGTAVTPTPAISGGLVTIVHSSHGYSSGDYIVLAGTTASPTPMASMNALVPIGTVTANTYTVPVSGSGSVGGTTKEMYWFSGTRSFGLPKIYNVTRSGTGFVKIIFLNTQVDSFYSTETPFGSDSTNRLFVSQDNSSPPSTTSIGFLFGSTTTAFDPITYVWFSFGGIQ